MHSKGRLMHTKKAKMCDSIEEDDKESLSNSNCKTEEDNEESADNFTFRSIQIVQQARIEIRNL